MVKGKPQLPGPFPMVMGPSGTPATARSTSNCTPPLRPVTRPTKTASARFTPAHAVAGDAHLQASAFATDTAETPRKRAPILTICCTDRVTENPLSLHPLDTAGAIEMPRRGGV